MRRRTFIYFFSFLLIAPVALAEELEQKSSMNEYLWRNRPLLVFAPHEDHSFLAAQHQAIAGQFAGLRDRDIVVIEVAGDRVIINGRSGGQLKAAVLRTLYGFRASDAAVLLVGKDGGVKLQQSSVVSAQVLFDTIDAMPMRQLEMGGLK